MMMQMMMQMPIEMKVRMMKEMAWLMATILATQTHFTITYLSLTHHITYFSTNQGTIGND